MTKYLALALIAVTLAGCKDYGRCLAGHEERYEALIQVGSIPCGNGCAVPIWGTIPSIRTVCDQWEFPDGERRK